MGKKFLLFFACLLMSASMAFAQSQPVTGTVIDSETGEPLVGATVRVEGTTIGTLTDVNGKFTLRNLPKDAEMISVSFMGMNTVKAYIKPHMAITLTPNAQDMNEVMVVAFGTATKESFTGSAKVVGQEELSKSTVNSVTNALAGAVPGLQLSSANGAPGSSPTIRVRGFSSINASNDPLIIVDGAPYPGDIGNINPNDVESMTVLKDAASTALYGARGSNGVIIITTKGGKKVKDATITFDAKYGSSSRGIPNYDVITSPAHYYEMHYQALHNYFTNRGQSADEAWASANKAILSKTADGGLGYNIWSYPQGESMFGMNGKLNPLATLGRVVDYKGEQYLLTPDDWEEVGTRHGTRQEYNVSASGSTEASNYYMNVSYLKSQGLTEASDLQRFSARLRGDYQLKKWLKVGGNMSYARFDGNTLGNNGTPTSTGNIWAFTTQMAPIFPAYIRNADGSYKYDSNGIRMMDYGEGLNAGSSRPFIYNANPIQDTRLNSRNYEGNAASGHGFADFQIYEDLTLTINGSYDLDETRGTYYYNPYYGQFDTTGGTLEKYHSRTYNYNFQQLLNYRHTFNNVHNLAVMLGHEYYDYRYAELGASKSQMFSPDNLELYGAVVDGQSAYSLKNRFNTEGYFGRAQYDYDTKYFASASLRRDASSRFAPDHRWGTFWSAGAAWLINKEKFFHADWVDQLKFKASYGSTGNDGIGSYRYTDLYGISNSAGYVGTSFSRKGNPDITWETMGNFNTGFEFSLWNGRLTGDIEYYYRKTSDMLYSFSVSPSLGYTSFYDNVGDMYNMGFEIDLGVNIIRNKNVDWSVNFNLATNKNKITSIPADNKVTSYYDLEGNKYDGYATGSMFRYEGSNVYGWRLKEYAGIYSENTWKMTSDAEYDASKAGLSMWYDRVDKLDDNGDPVKDANGEVVKEVKATTTWSDADYFVNHISAIPKVSGGIGTTVKFYGFDFSINTSYQLGGKAYDDTYAQFMASPTNSSAGYNYHKDLLKSWSATNQGSDIPRFQFDDLYSASGSTRFLTSASYLNIENINFGYTFPKDLIRKAKLEGLRLYVAAENVYLFSARKGFDPRQTLSNTLADSGDTGYPNGTHYAPMRTISGGITVTF